MEIPHSESRLTLSFRGERLHATEFTHRPKVLPVRTSTVGGPRHRKIQWSGQAKALSVFLLMQVSWVYLDYERACREVEEARKLDREYPESAPLFVSSRGSVVATLAEALKAQRSAAIDAIFGEWWVVDKLFRKRIHPPSVWLDVRHFSPLDVTVLVDGIPQNDPSILMSLADAMQKSRWQSQAFSCVDRTVFA